jgi:8-oxo-dGTP diphosphatase
MRANRWQVPQYFIDVTKSQLLNPTRAVTDMVSRTLSRLPRRCRAPILNRVSGSVIPCVGGVIKDDEGRLLLIKRGHAPSAGLWSLPGGRIEPGETDAEALVREMREETGLAVEPGRLLGSVRRPGQRGDALDIRDYAATVTGGTLHAGDDAAEARWVAPGELDSLPITEGLVEALTDWGVLSRRRHLSSYFFPLALIRSGCSV